MNQSNQNHQRERMDDLVEARLSNLEKQIERILKALELMKGIIEIIEVKKDESK